MKNGGKNKSVVFIIVFSVYTRGETVQVFLPKTFSMGFSVQYACVPNTFSIVLTTARIGNSLETASFIHCYFVI